MSDERRHDGLDVLVNRFELLSKPIDFFIPLAALDKLKGGEISVMQGEIDPALLTDDGRHILLPGSVCVDAVQRNDDLALLLQHGPKVENRVNAVKRQFPLERCIGEDHAVRGQARLGFEPRTRQVCIRGDEPVGPLEDQFGRIRTEDRAADDYSIAAEVSDCDLAGNTEGLTLSAAVFGSAVDGSVSR